MSKHQEIVTFLASTYINAKNISPTHKIIHQEIVTFIMHIQTQGMFCLLTDILQRYATKEKINLAFVIREMLPYTLPSHWHSTQSYLAFFFSLIGIPNVLGGCCPDKQP